jgi:thymidylate synthase (FAD)
MIEIVQPGYYWTDTMIQMFPHLMGHVERCGRVCYKSEDKITDDSAHKFVANVCRNRHESVLEHATVTAQIVCSRACSHQLVRHRLAAYSQESQRYCNYGKNDHLRVICPPSIGLGPGIYWHRENTEPRWMCRVAGSQKTMSIRTPIEYAWLNTIANCYREYLRELQYAKPEDARYVLPNATKTEIATTFNLRQWRHVFRQRALNSHAQWEIRAIFNDILSDLVDRLPSVFADLVV